MSQKVYVDIERIIQVVCSVMNSSEEDILTDSREGQYRIPRQVCMFFAKDHTALSLSKIGERLGGKDHATVLHACKTVRNLYDTERDFRDTIDEIRNQITGYREPFKIMLQIRLSMNQYRNGRYVYTLKGQTKVSRLRTLFVESHSFKEALSMYETSEVDSINVYADYRMQMVEAKV